MLTSLIALVITSQTAAAAVAHLSQDHTITARQLANIPACPSTPVQVIINSQGWSICSASQYDVPSQQWPSTKNNTACAQLCASTAGCTTAVWDRKYTSCHLKGNPSNLNFKSDSNFDAVKLAYTPQAGTKITGACPFGAYDYKTTDGQTYKICPLSDYDTPNLSVTNGVKTASACADVCNSTQNCSKAVHDRKNNICYTKGNPGNGSFSFVVNPQYDTISKIAYTQYTPLSTCTTTPKYNVINGQGWEVCPDSQYDVPSKQWPNTPSNNACAELCANTAGCSHATWDHQSACHIKGSPAAPNWIYDTRYDAVKLAYKPNIGLQFPSNACPWGNTTYTANGQPFVICPLSDYRGATISVTNNIASSNACADVCAKTNGCQRAVWDSLNNICHVKAGIEGLALIAATQFQTITLASQLFKPAVPKAGTTAIFGTCGVSAQHLFLGNDDSLYIVDKTEANTLLVPSLANSALAASFSLSNGTCRGMPTTTNQFCAAGGVRPDGSWVSGGGNPEQNGQGQTNGLRGIRTLKPCDDSSCQWVEGGTNGQLQADRWYPGAETLADGSLIWLGGYNLQVFMPIPKIAQMSTAKYFPSKGAAIPVPVLDRAYPFNLYPLTHVLSDGRIFIAAGSKAALWDPKTQAETVLPDIPNGPRTYPSGGFNVLLPLSPANGYQETSMICGGAGVPASRYPADTGCPNALYNTPALTKCDVITPLANKASWKSAADLPEPRLMGNLIILPDATIALVNGAGAGTQGFGCGGPGNSLATKPVNTVQIYNPMTDKWSALATQIANRGYHSSATLLPDGSIVVGGSAPHDNVQPWAAPFPTDFRLEKIYPSYFDAPRPSNSDVPISYPYGGASFSVTFNSTVAANGAYLRLVRSGWSTHGLQMGQRSYELQRKVNGLTVTFSGMPNTPNIFPPGAALAFLVVNGIPSIGKTSIVGPGR